MQVGLIETRRYCDVNRCYFDLGCGSCHISRCQVISRQDASLIDAAMVVWKTKVRFIGVGTIGIAAIWTLLILMKPMIEGMIHSFRMLKGG